MTAVLTWLTIIVATVIVIVLGYYLVGIIIALKAAADDLAKLAGGLAAIANNTAPLRNQGMCYENLPIEFDEHGNAHLKPGVANLCLHDAERRGARAQA
jgi:hypothetical protein